MYPPKISKRIAIYLIAIAAITAICWDIVVATLDVEPGTFRYESEFDAISSATATVSIVTSDYEELTDPVARTINPSYKQIEEMVGKAIELQGGFDGVINKGDVVLIKVNLVGGSSGSGDGENTDVRVVKALVHHIHQYTEGDVTIQVAEGTARTNDDPTDPGSVWGISGYIELQNDPLMDGINLSLVNLNQSIEDMIEVDLGSKGTSAKQGSKYTVHRAQLEADVYIAVPVLKIHDTGITNALKLQIGSAPGCYYGYNKTMGTEHCPTGIFHDVDHRRWTTEAIVDLCNVSDIDFVVVDAVMCLETQKNFKGWNQVRFNTVLAGVDPVAVDHISANLMGLNPDDVAYITLAEKVGLGTNNPEYISQVGVPLSQAMKKVKKSPKSVGKFGQSNRTWILSQAFKGSDLSQEFFMDEANIEPLPGEMGWSQSVYFFDDRIDLYSYYQGHTGITYAFTYFRAEQAQEAELWLGTHEGIQVYLNGELVRNSTTMYSFNDGDRFNSTDKVQILEGRNTLLVKTINKFGDYSFTLNICEVEDDPYYDGNRVAGLKFYIDNSGTGSIISGIPENEFSQPSSLECYPNPASDHATFHFDLEKSRQTSLQIYDLSGRIVKSFGREFRTAGTHELTWYLDNNSGTKVSEGTYVCKLQTGRFSTSIKLLVK